MYRELLRLPVSTTAALIIASAVVDLTEGPGGSRITPLGPLTEGFRQIVGDVFGPWEKAQLIALSPSCQLVAHCDAPIPGRRVHVPLTVNEGCWVFHDGVWAQLEIGKGYEMNPTKVHGAVNWGATRRVHLIIDLL